MKAYNVLRASLHEQEIRRVIGVPGDGDFVIEAVAPLGSNHDRCLYFSKQAITPAIGELLTARERCVVIAPLGSALAGSFGTCRVLEVDRPRAAIAKVLNFIRTENRQAHWVTARAVSREAVISPLSLVDGNVEIGDGVVVEPFCTVASDVVIGRGSIIRSGARIGARVVIGEETVIGANAVLGSEGFGFVRDDAGNKMRIPHLGGVVIGSHVEIGALSVVQSGTISPTIIEDYAKIDDNVEIAHNARIGRGVSLTGGVVVGGSARVEAEAWLGVNSGIRDGRRVGSHALVGMGASLQDDLDDYAVARAPRAEIRPNLGKKMTP